MLITLSGPVGSGKTTLCQRLASLARKRRVPVAGVLAPAIVESGVKVGIQGVDLRDGRVRTLARIDRDLGGAHVGQYTFDDRALDWVAALCESALLGSDTPADALVFVDEIGRLELDQGGGLARLIPLLARPRDGTTVVIVRDTLLDQFLARVRGARVGERGDGSTEVPVPAFLSVPRVLKLDARCRDAAWQEISELALAGSGRC